MTKPEMNPSHGEDPHLIEVTDPEVKIEPYIEDMLGFVIFWGLAFVVFLQFFSRYILNDSYAWTEEISRYLLMWVTFIGGATAMRRGTHIGVEAIQHFLPDRLARLSRFIIDIITLGFITALCWFGITVTERMQIQTMTVIEWPMSIVYAGVALGCFLMLYRCVRVVFGNAKRGWREDPNKASLIID
jgi:TRAP-type C4-dicarboxylate transport system permease small subunit